MAILVFAGVLSVPSAVFAKASWYGSLRAGVKSSASDVNVFDGWIPLGHKGLERSRRRTHCSLLL